MQAPSPLKPLSPRTKWLIALCLCALVMLLEFLTYHMAYRIGYDEGMLTTPPVVVQKSDEKAMQNLSRFMADVFASRESLAGILDNREERLAWIRDPELRTETAWGLTRELISRDGVDRALPAARELIDAGYASGRYRVWAPRADAVAKALLAEHQYSPAYGYLKTAVEGYEKEGMAEPLVRALQTMSSIDQMLNRNEEANVLLQRAVDAAAHLGTDALPVRSRLMAAQGRLARATGRIPESRAYFKKALALCPQPDKTTGDLALASISMGEAMLEAGRKDEARELFLKGLTGSENASYLLNDCLNALRGLARISTEQGNYEEALAYLYQAEGAARGVLAGGPCILGRAVRSEGVGEHHAQGRSGSPRGFPEGDCQQRGFPRHFRPVPGRAGQSVAGCRGGGQGQGKPAKSPSTAGIPLCLGRPVPGPGLLFPGARQRYGGGPGKRPARLCRSSGFPAEMRGGAGAQKSAGAVLFVQGIRPVRRRAVEGGRGNF